MQSNIFAIQPKICDFSSQYASHPYPNWPMNPWNINSTICVALQEEFFGNTHYAVVSASVREESLQRIKEIRSLEDGWDGYGGYSPSKAVCDHVRRVVNVLENQLPALPSPDISPSSNGTVMLTWESEHGEAVIELGDVRFNGFIRRSGAFVPLSGESHAINQDEMSIISECLFSNGSD